jgi:hypothetical protein
LREALPLSTEKSLPSSTASSAPFPAGPGLPPVTPPSARFVIQLFLVPGLIVVVLLSVFGLFTWLFGGVRSPEQFLKDLRDPNPEIRWRGAHDLAQVIKRDDKLTANPIFALDLADLLRQTLRDNDQAERTWAEKSKSRPADNPGTPDKAVKDDRAFIQFLINCLGSCTVPVGAPLLSTIATTEDGADPSTVALRRLDAVWALANLGENLKRLDAVTEVERQGLQAILEREVSNSPGERGQWAGAALACVQARSGSGDEPRTLGVDRVLVACAGAADPVLRKFVALALTFWDGNAEENARMEAALAKLAVDDGHGAAADSQLRGREIRYQATEALARRGSLLTTKHFATLAEMLDEAEQNRFFRLKLQDGRDVPDEPTILKTIAGALKALAALHQKQPSVDLSEFYRAIDELKPSSNPALRSEAQRARASLDRH